MTDIARQTSADAGRLDGTTQATLREHDCDPTAGFIVRNTLPESDRAAYVGAYEAAFIATLKASRESASMFDLIHVRR